MYIPFRLDIKEETNKFRNEKETKKSWNSIRLDLSGEKKKNIIIISGYKKKKDDGERKNKCIPNLGENYTTSSWWNFLHHIIIFRTKNKWIEHKLALNKYSASGISFQWNYRKMWKGILLANKMRDIVTEAAAVRSQLERSDGALLHPSPSSQLWRQPLTYLHSTSVGDVYQQRKMARFHSKTKPKKKQNKQNRQ